MKIRNFFAISLVILLSSTAGAIFAQTAAKKAEAPRTNPLLHRLPESDSVALIDSRRFFDMALPKLLASNQPLLNKINAEIDRIQQRTSIDLRKFDDLAIGVKITKAADGSIDFDPVVLARGVFNANAIVGITKLASDGTYREEKSGGHTIYIFSVKDIANKQMPEPAGSSVAGAIEGAADILSHEIAVTSLSDNTLAIGSLDRVKETILDKTQVSSDITNLLTPYEGAVVSFAAYTPDGISQFVKMDNDELGKTLGSIRYLAGSLNVTPAATSAQLLARAGNVDDAQSIFDTAQGAQQLGGVLLGNSKKAEQKILARVVQNAKIARTGMDVTVNVSIPQSDLISLLSTIKK